MEPGQVLGVVQDPKGVRGVSQSQYNEKGLRDGSSSGSDSFAVQVVSRDQDCGQE